MLGDKKTEHISLQKLMDARAARLRALSKKAREDLARRKKSMDGLPISTAEEALELQNAHLIQAVTEAEKTKSAALHELEKYQLAFEHLQLRVAELESGKSGKTPAAAASSTGLADPSFATPNGGRTTPSLKSTPSAMHVLQSTQTEVKTPTLYLAGKRRRHRQSVYEMGSKTHNYSDELNLSSQRQFTVNNGDRPRFSSSTNYHDPTDISKDYSQSTSSSRMERLDEKHCNTSPKSADRRLPMNKEDLQLTAATKQGEGISLYHAALRHSPHKEMAPSPRDSHNKLSHTGHRTMIDMPDESRPHLLNFHRRADEVLGDRHSYHHHHPGLGARGFFQSVKNKRLGYVPHGLKHVEHARRKHESRKVGNQEDVDALDDASMDDTSNSSKKSESESESERGGNEERRRSWVMKVSDRNAATKTASAGNRMKKKAVTMVFGRRRNSTFTRESHLNMHPGLDARAYQGEHYSGTKPTYHHVTHADPHVEKKRQRQQAERKK